MSSTTPGNVIAVGVAVGTVGWLGWELVGRAAWLVGRAQREIEDRLWMRDERRQERFLRTHDRCHYTAEEIRLDIARERHAAVRGARGSARSRNDGCSCRRRDAA